LAKYSLFMENMVYLYKLHNSSIQNAEFTYPKYILLLFKLYNLLFTFENHAELHVSKVK
jgi:hypothetical protein